LYFADVNLTTAYLPIDAENDPQQSAAIVVGAAWRRTAVCSAVQPPAVGIPGSPGDRTDFTWRDQR